MLPLVCELGYSKNKFQVRLILPRLKISRKVGEQHGCRVNDIMKMWFSRISQQVKSMSGKELYLLGLLTSLSNRRLQKDRALMMFILTLRDSNLNLLHRYSALY